MKNNSFFIGVLVLLVGLCGYFFHQHPLKANSRLLLDEQNNVDIYRKANASVVNITTITLKQDFFFEVYPQKGVGSGAIIHPDGYIVTNDHVLGQAHKIVVTLHDKSNFEAKIIGRDPDTDIAIIKIDAKKPIPALKWATTSELFVGQKVLAIGNPFGLGGTLTTGVVSSMDREVRTPTGRVMKDIVQTDAAINPGNSGGPLLNSAGEFIGMNSQIFSTSGGSIGVGFAVSVTTVQKITDQLIRFGQVVRAWIGLEGIGMHEGLLNNFGVPLDHGVMVIGTHRKGPAAKAGLRPATKELVWGFRSIPIGGDIVFQLDKTPVHQMRDIQDYIFDRKIGETIEVHFYRDKKRMRTTLTLSYSPDVTTQSM